MALSEIEQHRVNKLFSQFCDQRIPLDIRNQIKLLYHIKGNKVFLIESRPYYDDPTKWTEMPIAHFEYTESSRTWSLFGYDRNSKRRPYSKGNLEKLIQDLDKDHLGFFWG